MVTTFRIVILGITKDLLSISRCSTSGSTIANINIRINASSNQRGHKPCAVVSPQPKEVHREQ